MRAVFACIAGDLHNTAEIIIQSRPYVAFRGDNTTPCPYSQGSGSARHAASTIAKGEAVDVPVLPHIHEL